MKRTAPAAILLAAGLIAGCSASEPLKKADFQSVVPTKSSEAGLEVPPDLTAPQIQNKYAVPSSGVASAQQMARETASTTQAGTQADNAGPVLSQVADVKMVRDGSERWLVVDNKSPQQLWPLLKAFWQDNGFTIKTEEPDIGVMETDWAENRAKLPADGIRSLLETVGLGGVYSTSQRDRFRVRLERASNGGTEVYFSHRGLDEVYTKHDRDSVETKWQPRAPDPELEAEMLARFMVSLGASETQAKAALKKEMSKAAPVAATTQAPINQGTLTINDSFDRAWRRVGLALDRIGLVVNDRDRSQGIYYVKPAQNDVDNSKSSSGFWSSLAFWRSDKNTNPLSPDETLRINVKQSTPSTTDITITDKQGKVISDGSAKPALLKLQTELQ